MSGLSDIRFKILPVLVRSDCTPTMYVWTSKSTFQHAPSIKSQSLEEHLRGYTWRGATTLISAPNTYTWYQPLRPKWRTT